MKQQTYIFLKETLNAISLREIETTALIKAVDEKREFSLNSLKRKISLNYTPEKNAINVWCNNKKMCVKLDT